MPFPRFFFRLALVASCFMASCGEADVVVLSNRTPRALDATVLPTGQRPYGVHIEPGDSLPVFTDKPLRLEFDAAGGRQSYPLDSNAAYFFGQNQGGRVDLLRIGLNGTPKTLKGRPLPGDARTAPPAEVTVKLLVDEEEAMRRKVWERRLRLRVALASEILERHANVRLRVVAVDQWQSNNETRDFFKSLREFEAAVDPKPARLAIGFTSQFETPRGRTHLGGIRGPLRSHLMVREWSRVVGEPEKLELLVHELGHFLGATHSPEPNSVMRPILADRQSRRADFKIRFDPVNTLIMSMVGEEMRRRGADRFDRLTVGTRMRLAQVYQTLEEGIPGDKAASMFRQLASLKTAQSTLAGQTRSVLHAIAAAAEENQARPVERRLTGDLLTERYVQAAAREAAKLSPTDGPKAFLVGLAMSVGDAAALRRGLQRRDLAKVEASSQQSVRIAGLGRPTARGRRDLAQHFFVSAGLTAGLGAAEAETLGYAKEAVDAQGGSGFSFVDIMANRAGIRFAERVLEGKFPLKNIAEHFRMDHYLPKIEGLPEGLSGREVVRRFGGQGDDRYTQQLAIIDARLDALPPYTPIMIDL